MEPGNEVVVWGGKGLGLGRVRVSPPQTTVRVTSLTDIYFSITLQSQETLAFL